MRRSVPLLLAALAAAAPGVRAQDAVIRPAAEIRVVEVSSPGGGFRRDVVDALAPAEILRLQVELARAGHDPGSRSGELDGSTRQALTGFQAARRLVVCACPSYETVVALGIPPVVVARSTRAAYVGGPGPVVTYGRSGGVYVGHVPAGVYVGHAPPRAGHRPSRGSDGVRRPARPDPDPRPTYRPSTRTGGRIRAGDGADEARPERPSP